MLTTKMMMTMVAPFRRGNGPPTRHLQCAPGAHRADPAAPRPCRVAEAAELRGHGAAGPAGELFKKGWLAGSLKPNGRLALSKSNDLPFSRSPPSSPPVSSASSAWPRRVSPRRACSCRATPPRTWPSCPSRLAPRACPRASCSPTASSSATWPKTCTPTSALRCTPKVSCSAVEIRQEQLP